MANGCFCAKQWLHHLFCLPTGGIQSGGVIDKWAQRQVWASANKMKIKNMCNQLQAAWCLLINKMEKLWE